jgi:hypothetical protein
LRILEFFCTFTVQVFVDLANIIDHNIIHMCVIFLSVGATQGYKLIVLANRDELLDRPTEAAKFWEDSGFLILGGNSVI